MNAPSKAMELKAAISAVLAGMTAFWGWTGWLVVIWLVAMILDYATGSWAALSTGTRDSAVARAGLWHKLGSIAAVLVAVMCDIALGVIAGKLGDGFISVDYGCVITPIVAAWYIFTELGSVIENAAKLGAPMPKFLKKLVSGLRDAADDAGDRKGK